MAIGDRMFSSDEARLKLECAHNHPEQGDESRCKLCGVQLQHPQPRGDAEDGQSQTDEGRTPG